MSEGIEQNKLCVQVEECYQLSEKVDGTYHPYVNG